MATHKETVEFILEKLREPKHFKSRAMFGEYALYADGKVVALICDDILYAKIKPASKELEKRCEQGSPYPGAKPYYVVEEEDLTKIEGLPNMLLAIARELPAKKKIKKKGRRV